VHAVVAAAVAVAVMLGACSGTETDSVAPILGEVASPEYAAAQAQDLPPGVERCEYSGSIPFYVESMKSLGVDPAAIDGTWESLQATGAIDSFIAVYADTAEACSVWVKGSATGHVHAGSRIVSTVVVEFADEAGARAGYEADVFKQSQLAGQQGVRVLSGPSTMLGDHSVVSASEAANPTVHQAVWQAGPFNVFFTGRNLTRTEFERATTGQNQRLTAL
jgi:hypothetical protein